MNNKIIGFVTVWLLVTFIPIFAFWTMGIPFHGFTFWFDEKAIFACIWHFWLMGIMTLLAAYGID